MIVISVDFELPLLILELATKCSGFALKHAHYNATNSQEYQNYYYNYIHNLSCLSYFTGGETTLLETLYDFSLILWFTVTIVASAE